ncbi:hypothetical protein C8R44DRAFT_742406 [Mycena epipterygia]|nr:hypothetical protein C8R44DRAFT_742406 [Mycena epipterygia]
MCGRGWDGDLRRLIGSTVGAEKPNTYCQSATQSRIPRATASGIRGLILVCNETELFQSAKSGFWKPGVKPNPMRACAELWVGPPDGDEKEGSMSEGFGQGCLEIGRVWPEMLMDKTGLEQLFIITVQESQNNQSPERWSDRKGEQPRQKEAGPIHGYVLQIRKLDRRAEGYTAVFFYESGWSKWESETESAFQARR